MDAEGGTDGDVASNWWLLGLWNLGMLGYAEQCPTKKSIQLKDVKGFRGIF